VAPCMRATAFADNRCQCLRLSVHSCIYTEPQPLIKVAGSEVTVAACMQHQQIQNRLLPFDEAPEVSSADDFLSASRCGMFLIMRLILCWKLTVSFLAPHEPLAPLWVAQLAEPNTVTVTVKPFVNCKTLCYNTEMKARL